MPLNSFSKNLPPSQQDDADSEEHEQQEEVENNQDDQIRSSGQVRQDLVEELTPSEDHCSVWIDHDLDELSEEDLDTVEYEDFEDVDDSNFVDFVPDLMLSKERQYNAWKAAYPRIQKYEQVCTARAYPELEEMDPAYRKKFFDWVQAQGVPSRPPWLTQADLLDRRYLKDPRFQCRVTNAQGKVPSRYNYSHKAGSKPIRKYSYQWSTFLDNGNTKVLTRHKGKLQVSHICHNHFCHIRKHLTLKPSWLNNMRQICLQKLKRGERFVCQHPGVPCYKRFDDGIKPMTPISHVSK